MLTDFTNLKAGHAFKTELATAYPECRLIATKETMNVEGMIRNLYDLLMDKLYFKANVYKWTN